MCDGVEKCILIDKIKTILVKKIYNVVCAKCKIHLKYTLKYS